MTEPDSPDLLLGGRLRLHQPQRGAHRAGTDAVLLGNLITPDRDAVVCDVGAGTGAVGLIAAVRAPDCRIILVERDPALAALALANATLNRLADRVAVIEADVLAAGPSRHLAGLTSNLADVVLTNPPFFDHGRHRPSPVPGKAAAHGLEPGGLDVWVRTCLDLLKPRGRLGLIHRADALPECLAALRTRFGSIAVRPVHARATRPAIRVLITAVKGSRAPFALLPSLVLQEADGAPSAEVAAMGG
ncbi:MAG TPA: methyltransferase [Methylobacterium sp.]|jgi:tRNA1(Val) A37 N6-methylase TrmN6